MKYYLKKVISSTQMKPKAMKDLCTQRCHSSRLADRLSFCVCLNIFVWIFGRDRNENVHIKPLLFFYLVFETHCIERQQWSETQRNPGRFYLLVFGKKQTFLISFGFESQIFLITKLLFSSCIHFLFGSFSMETKISDERATDLSLSLRIKVHTSLQSSFVHFWLIIEECALWY